MIESDLQIGEKIKERFIDIPVELFLERLATPDEVAIVRNTFLLTDRDQRGKNQDYCGMVVHLGRGYLASARHVFNDYLLIEGAPHSLPLKNAVGTEQRVEAMLVAAGSQMLKSNFSRHDEDWIIFKALPNELDSFQLPSFPLSNSPNGLGYKARALIAGVPGILDLYTQGAGSFANVGEQMTVRFSDQLEVEQLRSRTKSDFPPTLVRQIRLNFTASGGYSGGPMIINQRLAGITCATNGNDLTFGIATDYYLAQLRKKGIDLLDE